MKRIFAALTLTLGAAACVPTTHQTLAVSCSEYIGKPIAGRIKAFGPPKTVYRINDTQVGYVFEAEETRYVGGEPYYTVNYMTGVDKHHRPIRRLTTVCSGVFVVRAPSDMTPISERIILDVIAP